MLQLNDEQNFYSEVKEIEEFVKLGARRLKPIRAQKLECRICKLRFPYEVSLKQHFQNSHESQKPFQCKICKNENFYLKHELTEHIKTSHEKVQPVIFKNYIKVNDIENVYDYVEKLKILC